MIGGEQEQKKNEVAVRKLVGNMVEWERERIESYRAQENQMPPPRARVGDLAIARCWPYPDMYRICYVSRVDDRGWPTHLRDGAGTRYADNACETTGVTIMPETCMIVSRERLAVPAREIAAEHRESHFCGVDLQAIVDHVVSRHLKVAS